MIQAVAMSPLISCKLLIAALYIPGDARNVPRIGILRN